HLRADMRVHRALRRVSPPHPSLSTLLFCFNAAPTTEFYTLSLHDALPIFKAAELFAFTLRVRAGNTDVLTDAEENVSVSCAYTQDRKSGSAGMPRPNSYAVFCLKKKKEIDTRTAVRHRTGVDVENYII